MNININKVVENILEYMAIVLFKMYNIIGSLFL